MKFMLKTKIIKDGSAVRDDSHVTVFRQGEHGGCTQAADKTYDSVSHAKRVFGACNDAKSPLP